MDEVAPVLLVDDEVRNLEALEAVLAASGCRLVRAQSADQALLAILEHDFAAIVLDIRMPGMDGIELARLIKLRKRSQHVPILLLTAHLLDEHDIHRGYAAGAVDYLTKPLSPDILRSKIAVFVDLYRKSRALALANASLQREILERERAEQALSQAKQQLEARVQERTAELSEAHGIMRVSEERLRIALDAGRMGTWEVDEATGDTQADDVQCALLGLPAGTRRVSYDEAYERVIHPDDVDRVRSTVGRARATFLVGDPDVGAGAFEVEFRVRRPGEDDFRWLSTRGRFMRDHESGPIRIVGVSFDITDRKVIEEALRDADRRKNEFLATLAHELRNPLAPIRTAVEVLIAKGDQAQDLVAARRVIARQTHHLARLVDDLLDISRITRDRLELRREPVDLSAVVAMAIETSRPLLEAGNHDLTVSVPDEPIILDGDLTRLAQVVSNILNNAAKYSDRSGPIELRAWRDRTTACIQCADRGVGIEPAILPRIFDMFVQGDGPRERTETGLGVGLALARRLVEMHEGVIAVESTPGQGSMFTIRLPIRQMSALEIMPTLVSEEPMTTSLRVLVVDDNRDAVDSLSVLLELHGNEVRAAHDGLTAIEAAAEFVPDVVLLDIGLPKLNGYEAAKRMRAQAAGRPLVLIALTGWGQEEDRHRSYMAGFDHHLVKPVEPAALMHLMTKLTVHQTAGHIG